MRLHYRENSGPDDTRNNLSNDRTSRIDFRWYLSENIWTVLGLAPYDYYFMELFLAVNYIHRMGVLPEKLVPWELMKHDQELALLAKASRLPESDKSWSVRLAKLADASEHYDAAKENHIYA